MKTDLLKKERTLLASMLGVIALFGIFILLRDQFVLRNQLSLEKEVAFLLLKGLSLKEIAEVRQTVEKTARLQATAVYEKSGLAGRSELSAFFLEDLLPPQDQPSLKT